MKTALAAAALLAMGGTGAAADPAKRVVAILDVNVEGIPTEAAHQFEQRLDQQIDTSRFWVASAKSTHEHLASSTTWTDGCVVGACLAEVKTQAGAELALLATLTGAGTSFGYVVTLVRTDTGNVLAQKSARCDVCTVTDAIQGASDAVRALLADVPTVLPDSAAERSAAATAAAHERSAAAAHAHRRAHQIGVGLSAAGIVAAAAGAGWYFGASHARGGAVVGGLGAGLAVSGVLVLTF